MELVTTRFASSSALSAVLVAVGVAPAQQTSRVVLPAAADATIHGDSATRANGRGQHLFVGTTNHAEVRRSLLRFDVAAAVPPGARVLAVELRLTLDRTFHFAPLPVAVHRVAASWSEGAADPIGHEGGGAPAGVGDCTWFHRSLPTSTWTAPGGDHEAVPSAVGDTPETLGPFVWANTPRLAADVQGWLDAPATNHGWLLRTDEALGGAVRRFASRDHSVAADRPALVVDYLMPGTWSGLAAGCPGAATNMSVHGATTAGGSVTFRFDASGTATVGAIALALAVDLPGASVAPGCRLVLERGSTVVTGFGTVGGGAALVWPVAVPTSPSFRGVLLAAQGAVFAPSPVAIELGAAAAVLLP